jgi:hypothetical protein
MFSVMPLYVHTFHGLHGCQGLQQIYSIYNGEYALIVKVPSNELEGKKKHNKCPTLVIKSIACLKMY